MKKKLFSFITVFLSFISFSQTIIGLGVGYENSAKESLTAIKIDFETLKIAEGKSYRGFILGFELGLNFLKDDQTGKLNLNPQEETGNYLYTVITPAVKLGWQINKNFYLIGAAGLNSVQEHREYKSSSSGIYSVETAYKKDSPYFRGGLKWVNNSFSPEIGFGTNGFFVGGTIYFSNKIKDAKSNFKYRVDNKGKYILGGKDIVNIRYNKYEEFVDAAINYINENTGQTFSIYDFEITDNIKDDNIVIQSKRRNSDNKIEMFFNKQKWKQTDINSKLYQLFNQLSRVLLDFGYGEGGPMTNELIKKGITEKDYFDDRSTMIKLYNEMINKTSSEDIIIEN